MINNDSVNSINRAGISSLYITNTELNKNKEKTDINYRNTVNTTNIKNAY